jgi:hypothetical protein
MHDECEDETHHHHPYERTERGVSQKGLERWHGFGDNDHCVAFIVKGEKSMNSSWVGHASQCNTSFAPPSEKVQLQNSRVGL